MLKHLSIRNFILIRELEMDFQHGFTVVTGETGAGKSIFLGALGLLLGERADLSSLSDQSSKCVVEGVFEISGVVEKDFFEEQELDYDNCCIIRREILPQGKSRAFINDTPVGLHVLKVLAEKLIDVHSQHSTILLAKNAFHLSLLDAVAGTTEKYKFFLKQWTTYRQMMLEIVHLKEELLGKEKDKDYYAFLVQEIVELNTKAGENDELESRLLVLRNAEKIKSILHESSAGLKYDENNICGMISNLSEKLRSVSDFFPVLGDLDQRLKSTIVEIDDIATELSVLHEKIDDDPAELAAKEERLNEIHRLLFKHQQNDSDGLLKVKDEMASRLSEIDLCGEQIDALQKQAELMLEIIAKLAEELSQARRDAVPALEKSIADILHVLAMPHAVFQVECHREEQLSAKGFDNVFFQFSANKGEATQELSKVASGGEMSRVMLALKSVIARSSSLPTLVFDEIDSGVSGETAKKMAGIFQEMGKNIQLVVITHLPQVAAKAQHHLLVSKTDMENSTATTMQQLNTPDRIVEIAKMLGGENYTESTIRTVKDLMQN